MRESLLVLSLARLTFLTCAEKLCLEEKFASAEDFSRLSLKDISLFVERDFSFRTVYDPKENLYEAQRELAVCNKMKISFVHVKDSAYPPLLKELTNPPYLLFYRGRIENLHCPGISVVGTRKLTPYGRASTIEFSKNAALDGNVIVSGLAAGADAAAHKGAIDAWFQKPDIGFVPTVGVLPCSIDEITPRTNVKLAEKILKNGGLVISEYAPMIQTANWHFVHRNRIIAGLTPVTVVTQAPPGSGALITADYALQMGRDLVFHKSCFGEQAENVSRIVKHELDIGFARNQVSRSKIEHTVETFVFDGAPVIEDYKDFCSFMKERPGERSFSKEKGIIQLSLFEDFIEV